MCCARLVFKEQPMVCERSPHAAPQANGEVRPRSKSAVWRDSCPRRLRPPRPRQGRKAWLPDKTDPGEHGFLLSREFTLQNLMKRSFFFFFFLPEQHLCNLSGLVALQDFFPPRVSASQWHQRTLFEILHRYLNYCCFVLKAKGIS